MKQERTRYRNSFVIALYEDSSGWVAHNLSLDIVAVDKDKAAAIEELRMLTMKQIEFCVRNGYPEIINHPAPERFWKLVAEKQTAQVMADIIGLHLDAKEVMKNSQVIEIDPSVCPSAQTRQPA